MYIHAYIHIYTIRTIILFLFSILANSFISTHQFYSPQFSTPFPLGR